MYQHKSIETNEGYKATPNALANTMIMAMAHLFTAAEIHV